MGPKLRHPAVHVYMHTCVCARVHAGIRTCDQYIYVNMHTYIHTRVRAHRYMHALKGLALLRISRYGDLALSGARRAHAVVIVVKKKCSVQHPKPTYLQLSH